MALQADGRVVAAGSVANSTQFRILLARYRGGNAHCFVPRVKGKTLRKAKRAIHRADCSLGRVRKRFSRIVRKGCVISQRPRPRTRHAAGTKVRLVVSTGRRR